MEANDVNSNLQRMTHFPGVTAATAQLVDVLRRGKAGDTATDDQLCGVVGASCAVGGPHYGHLQSAIRISRRQYGVVWQRVPKAGYLKCLDAGERVTLSKCVTERVHKLARRGVQILATVDPAQLDDKQRSEFGAQLAIAGTLAAMSTTTTRRAFVDHGVTQAAELPKLLAAFQAGQAGKRDTTQESSGR